jgi:hypothetical protein
MYEITMLVNELVRRTKEELQKELHHLELEEQKP